MLTQLGWFFGGERFLRATTGLTAAEYARRGFFQMVWVVALVVPLLLVDARGAARRSARSPGDTRCSRFPIVGLLGAIIVSAALRMRLYVHYYGLTTDRLYTLVFMGWLAHRPRAARRHRAARSRPAVRRGQRRLGARPARRAARRSCPT